MTFKTVQKIKDWANTTFYSQKDGLLQIKKHPENLYYYFGLENGIWTFKMTSLKPYFFDGE